jgi:hypothetical protein
MSRSRSMRLRPSRSSSTLGTVSTGSPVLPASSSARRRCAVLAPGMAMTMCVALPRTSLSRTASSGPSTCTSAMRARRLAGSSSSRPSTTQPCSWMPASSMRAAWPAPITSARRSSALLPLMRERRCS